jgi:probable F420-dependent oxidoreductase
LRRWAELTEALGYHHLMTSDHIAVTPDVGERYPGPLYEPLTTLAWLAGVTRRVRIGSTVIILPYRNPLLVARAIANIDRLSGGRCIFGVGVGWSRQEYEALGVPFARRGAIADEYLAAIKRLWTSETASFDGRFVRFKNVDCRPLPAQTPHPPIWVGGRSDAALRRAVRFGDGWHPLGIRCDWLRDEGMPRLAEIAAEEGRPPPALCPRIRLRLTDAPLPEDTRVAGEGTLDQVRRDLAELEALGAAHVLLDTYAGDPAATRDPTQAWRMLTTMAETVLDLGRETLR